MTPSVPAWAVRPWGLVRVGVVLASLVAVVGVVLLGDVDAFEGDAAIQLVAAGCVAAGFAGAARFAMLSVIPRDARLSAITRRPDQQDERRSSALTRPVLRDMGWSLLLVAGAFTVRAVWDVAVLGRDPFELLLPLLAVFVWFTAYLVGLLPGLLVALTVSSAIGLAGAHRRGVPVAPEWWAVPTVFAALLVFAVTALLSVTLLGAPSSRGLGGFLGLVLWDFHGLEGWALALAWTTRISGYVIVLSIAVLIVGRVRSSRPASTD